MNLSKLNSRQELLLRDLHKILQKGSYRRKDITGEIAAYKALVYLGDYGDLLKDSLMFLNRLVDKSNL